MSLDGKVALVTGSTSGIGLAIAQAFAAEGCNVTLNGLGDAGAIAKLSDDLAKMHGVKVAYHGADMSKPAEIADLVADTRRQFGGVDILVNNAGIQHVAPVEDFPPDKWDAIIAINLSSSFHTIRAAKHGIVGVTKVIGLECADTGVTCNAICPGWVLTPLVQAQIEARAKERKISVQQASRDLISEKQPQLSDGGWTAQ